MRFRKPELIPVLFILCATALLSALGAWQLVRLGWKETLINTVSAAQSMPQLEKLPESLDGLAYRSAVVRGTFANDKALRLVGRKKDMRAGFFVLTPLVLEDGRAILVNRGYAEEGHENPAAGRQEIHGVLRPPREKRPFTPDNDVQKNLWFYEDMAAISATTGLTLLPLVVEATGKGKKNLQPIPSDGKITLRNDHLGYAVTWFSLALIGLIMFGFYYREPQNKA